MHLKRVNLIQKGWRFNSKHSCKISQTQFPIRRKQSATYGGDSFKSIQFDARGSTLINYCVYVHELSAIFMHLFEKTWNDAKQSWSEMHKNNLLFIKEFFFLQGPEIN